MATKQVIIKLILRRGNGTINCPDDIIIFYTRSNVLFTLSTANLTLTWKAYYAPRLTSMFLTSTFVVYIHCCRARLEALYLFLFLFIFFRASSGCFPLSRRVDGIPVWGEHTIYTYNVNLVQGLNKMSALLNFLIIFVLSNHLLYGGQPL